MARCIVSSESSGSVAPLAFLQAAAGSVVAAVENPAAPALVESDIAETPVATPATASLDASAEPAVTPVSEEAAVVPLAAAATPSTPDIEVVTPAKQPCHNHHHNQPESCDCHWWDRLTAFDWLHILTEVLVHIILHAVLTLSVKAGKKAARRRKHATR